MQFGKLVEMFGWRQAKGMGYDFTTSRFAYNNSINRSTSKSPFHIVYGSSPRKAYELRQLNKGEISSAKAKEFVEYLKNDHEEVRKHITKMNIQYKAKEDVKMRHNEF